MAIQYIKSGKDVPSSALPFSPAVHAGDFVFISGQASVDMNGNIISDTFANECIRSFENVKKVLNAAGLTFKDVAQVRNYVAQQSDLPEFNRIYQNFFSEPYPARTTLIGCLSTLLKFEVDVIAYKRK